MELGLRLESWPFPKTGSLGCTCLDAEDVRLDSGSSGTEYDSTQLNSIVGQWRRASSHNLYMWVHFQGVIYIVYPRGIFQKGLNILGKYDILCHTMALRSHGCVSRLGHLIMLSPYSFKKNGFPLGTQCE